jgi:hypothetical protein
LIPVYAGNFFEKRPDSPEKAVGVFVNWNSVFYGDSGSAL